MNTAGEVETNNLKLLSTNTPDVIRRYVVE